MMCGEGCGRHTSRGSELLAVGGGSVHGGWGTAVGDGEWVAAVGCGGAGKGSSLRGGLGWTKSIATGPTGEEQR